MARDKDLAALLPEPPPPRPTRREGAIAQAMRRFDGHGEAAPPTVVPAEPARVRWLTRPQFASLTAMAAVAVLSTSVWLSQKERFAEPTASREPAREEAPAAARRALGTRAASDDPAPPSAVPPPAEATQARRPDAPAEALVPPPPPATFAEAGSPGPPASAAQRRQPPPPDFAANSPAVAADQDLNRLPVFPAPPAPAGRASSEGIVVSGSRVARADSGAEVAPAAAAPQRAERAEAARYEWNACTVLDPARSLQACGALASLSARGARGRAAAQLADGLTFAWRGEPERALAAFDRAIGLSPDFALAYLNRALIHRQNGDLAQARADLDRAVAGEPGSARAYYHRGQLRRATGDAAGAEADQSRAAQLQGGG